MFKVTFNAHWSLLQFTHMCNDFVFQVCLIYGKFLFCPVDPWTWIPWNPQLDKVSTQQILLHSGYQVSQQSLRGSALFSEAGLLASATVPIRFLLTFLRHIFPYYNITYFMWETYQILKPWIVWIWYRSLNVVYIPDMIFGVIAIFNFSNKFIFVHNVDLPDESYRKSVRGLDALIW